MKTVCLLCYTLKCFDSIAKDHLGGSYNTDDGIKARILGQHSHCGTTMH